MRSSASTLRRDADTGNHCSLPQVPVPRPLAHVNACELALLHIHLASYAFVGDHDVHEAKCVLFQVPSLSSVYFLQSHRWRNLAARRCARHCTDVNMAHRTLSTSKDSTIWTHGDLYASVSTHNQQCLFSGEAQSATRLKPTTVP